MARKRNEPSAAESEAPRNPSTAPSVAPATPPPLVSAAGSEQTDSATLHAANRAGTEGIQP
jgi:hypothetical protein